MTKAGLGVSFAPAGVMGKVPAPYSTESVPLDEKVLHVKWFSPYSGWTWYVAEYNPLDGDCFGYVVGAEREWGYFNARELEALRGMGGRLPMVERDVGWEPRTFANLPASHR